MMDRNNRRPTNPLAQVRQEEAAVAEARGQAQVNSRAVKIAERENRDPSDPRIQVAAELGLGLSRLQSILDRIENCLGIPEVPDDFRQMEIDYPYVPGTFWGRIRGARNLPNEIKALRAKKRSDLFGAQKGFRLGPLAQSGNTLLELIAQAYEANIELAFLEVEWAEKTGEKDIPVALQALFNHCVQRFEILPDLASAALRAASEAVRNAALAEARDKNPYAASRPRNRGQHSRANAGGVQSVGVEPTGQTPAGGRVWRFGAEVELDPYLAAIAASAGR